MYMRAEIRRRWEELKKILYDDGDTVDKVMESVRNDVPPLPSSHTSMPVPELLEEMIMQCLAKKPEARLQSMGELIRLLKQCF